MALGDTGIAPLDHVAGYAVFANGGKAVKPYAILELRNTRDELVYSRERDEPLPAQIFKREDIETLNTMLLKVVEEGTGMAAKLDFTYACGKTGTTSGPKDVWFMGFTGQYVTGVWFGNDDYSDMMSGTTGGHLSAPVWHQYMVAAHTNMDIPQIPGFRCIRARSRSASGWPKSDREDPNASPGSSAAHGPHRNGCRSAPAKC